MKILGIDTSAKTASVALAKDNNIIDEVFINQGLTHSETLLPMIDELLNRNNCEICDINLIAVNNGPGSFTGVRIGVAVAKGLSFSNNIKCCEVSTVDSIAYNCIGYNGLVVAVMDARRNQMYNAVYKASKGNIEKIKNDRSILIEDLFEELKGIDDNIYFVGDGEEKVKEYFENNEMLKDNFIFPDYLSHLQNGKTTAQIAYQNKDMWKEGDKILPSYLKLSQAEQELKKKREEK